MTRRRFLNRAAAAAGAGALMLMPWDGPMMWWSGPLPASAERAIAVYNAMQTYMYRPNLAPGETLPLYLDQTPQNNTNPYSFSWPLSQAAAGTLDMLGLPDGRQIYMPEVQARVRGSVMYWNGGAYASYVTPPLGDGGLVFYDDSVWLGLNDVRYHRLTGDGDALDRADRVFRFLVSGWDGDPHHPVPGGVFWVVSNENRDRNTCENGAGAELGVRLYQLTGRQQYYLDWAKKMYAWPRKALLSPDGLYYDHMDVQGNIDGGIGSYNQGVMIGAGALLYQATHDSTYLAQAKNTLAATLRYFSRTGYGAQNPAYVTIFFRNALFLSTVDATYLPATLEAMQQYANDCWAHCRNEHDLFSFPGDNGTTPLRAQGAMVTLYACLAWDQARYDLLI